MKNKEKYADEIMSVALRHSKIALHEGKIRSCDGLSCSLCGFFKKNHGEDIVTCDEYVRKWVEQECKEQAPKLTKRERAFIDFIVSDFTLVRASDGTLYLNCFSTLAELDSDMFTFVNEVVDKKTLLSYEVES